MIPINLILLEVTITFTAFGKVNQFIMLPDYMLSYSYFLYPILIYTMRLLVFVCLHSLSSMYNTCQFPASKDEKESRKICISCMLTQSFCS